MNTHTAAISSVLHFSLNVIQSNHKLVAPKKENTSSSFAAYSVKTTSEVATV